MQAHVLQQVFPNWDTLRIMRSPHDHLDWMHRHFASTVVTGSEILAEMRSRTAMCDGFRAIDRLDQGSADNYSLCR